MNTPLSINIYQTQRVAVRKFDDDNNTVKTV